MFWLELLVGGAALAWIVGYLIGSWVRTWKEF